MKKENKEQAAGNKLHSLIPLADFKAVLGIDDREDAMSRYCLATATYTIEQYCMRWLLRKRHLERIEYTGDLLLPLREYPVNSVNSEQVTVNSGKILGKEFFRAVPDCGTYIDIPFSIELSPEVRKLRGLKFIKVAYWAGYPRGKVPPDLASACLELAAWNMSRYRGRRIGMTGNVRGSGEHLEMSIPVQVRQLLEPYRRRVI